MASNESWKAIFKHCKIDEHNFDLSPFPLSGKSIKRACQNFTETGQKEVRILCKQDSRENVPDVMAKKGLFLLPVKNGHYVLIKGEGYFDVPKITGEAKIYSSKLGFGLETTKIGNSEMQHLDHAYAVSIIRSFMDDPSLVLTIRGRKYTSPFSFKVGKHVIETKSVQTEVDAGYEGKNQVVLVEAKNSKTNNTIIRQLFYPFRQWSAHTNKEIKLVFFEKRGDDYMLWQYEFADADDYNSIRLIKSARYRFAA